MTMELAMHEVTVSLVEPIPTEVCVGTELALGVRISCSSKCSLHQAKATIIDADGTLLSEADLAESDGAGGNAGELFVKVPSDAGEYHWAVVFPAQEIEGALHAESSAEFSFLVKPHAIEVAVHDVPSTIVCGAEFTIRVGVQCSTACNLTHQQIQVCDHSGARVATATLSEGADSGASELFCVEVALQAPSEEGRYRWKVKIEAPDLELGHAEASFAFATIREPQHLLTVEVINKETKAPVANACIVLRPHAYKGSAFRSRTNDAGVAELRVPTDRYQLYVSGDQYERLLPTIEVTGDLTIKTELTEPLYSWRMIPWHIPKE